MLKTFQEKSIFISETILNSYAQVFFSENKLLGSLLLLVSFLDWKVGLSGIIAVITSVILSTSLGYSLEKIRKGFYSFNALLVGLGVGTYFALSIETLFLVAIGSIVAVFITVFLIGLLQKYGLPFLSLPFLLAIWLLLLSFPSFTNVAVNTDAIYPSNMFFKLGGETLVYVVDSLNNIFNNTGFDTYFLSLGAIFFQFNILAGVLIAVGLLFHSRIHFLFSLIGFFVAYWFYSFLGVSTGALNYTYYGFNFILSAIAIGGYFLIPSKHSLLWSLVLIPILVITTIGSNKLFSYFELSIFSLPFNLILIGVLYTFKIRYDQTKKPILTPIQQKNPETNAYIYDSQIAKKYVAYTIPIRLPFRGEWTVNQAHNGKYTHKQFYSFAWDFVIKNSDGKEFSNDGYAIKDYYCFGKPVIAPASGTVVAVVNTIDDNEIGVTNTLNNWGNAVIIKHENFLYSKLTHLKKGSVKVEVGDFVVEGEQIGNCGNSGRSPFPHLHFQLQSTPEIGSSTIFWPLSEYTTNRKQEHNFVQKGVPVENETIGNINTSALLEKAFDWNSGDEFKLQISINDENKIVYEIQNRVDIYNQTYLYCKKTKAKLYYINNGKLFSALNYVGSKKSPLFYFYKSLYKVIFSEQSNLLIKLLFPVHHLYSFPLLTIQDFLLPLGIFLKGTFRLNYKKDLKTFNTKEIEIGSQIVDRKKRPVFSAQIKINEKREIIICCKTTSRIKINLQWGAK